MLTFAMQARQTQEIGSEVDRYREVPIFENGKEKDISHGRHYSRAGYYYGQKWQCVEFVKRFYDQVLDHKLPDVWGHARDYFDTGVVHGEINPRRNLLQFRNSGNVKPAIDDIMIFSDTRFGHVVIVTEVNTDSVEVIQQNITGKPRQLFQLQEQNGQVTVSSPRIPDGWLRRAGVSTSVV